MSKYPDRIPYDSWANSQLSVVKHTGSCTINGESYDLDWEDCQRINDEGEEAYFPDLVKTSVLKKTKDNNKTKKRK